MQYDVKDPESVHRHQERHDGWARAVAKYGFCWSFRQQETRHESRHIANDSELPLELRVEEAENVIRAYFSRSLAGCDYDLSHPSFSEYAARFLYSQSHSFPPDVQKLLVDKFGLKTGMRGAHWSNEAVSAESTRLSDLSMPPLSPVGQRIGYAYEKAPQREQSIVEQVLEPYIDDTEDVIYIKWRISEQAAASGNGIYLGPETFTEYEVDESKLPRGAAFGVPISGDSMEPKYHDGDIAIISKDFPDVGQVGLFTYDGNGYIKKRGEGVLESLNPKYGDIPITDDVIINGRVIGVITWDDVRK